MSTKFGMYKHLYMDCLRMFILFYLYIEFLFGVYYDCLNVNNSWPNTHYSTLLKLIRYYRNTSGTVICRDISFKCLFVLLQSIMLWCGIWNIGTGTSLLLHGLMIKLH